MSFCPFISTPTEKKEPNGMNCRDCCFYIYQIGSGAPECAILATAVRTIKMSQQLSQNKIQGFPLDF